MKKPKSKKKNNIIIKIGKTKDKNYYKCTFCGVEFPSDEKPDKCPNCD